MLEKSINDTRKQLFTKYLFLSLWRCKWFLNVNTKVAKHFLVRAGGRRKRLFLLLWIKSYLKIFLHKVYEHNDNHWNRITFSLELSNFASQVQWESSNSGVIEWGWYSCTKEDSSEVPQLVLHHSHVPSPKLKTSFLGGCDCRRASASAGLSIRCKLHNRVHCWGQDTSPADPWEQYENRKESCFSQSMCFWVKTCRAAHDTFGGLPRQDVSVMYCFCRGTEQGSSSIRN